MNRVDALEKELFDLRQLLEISKSLNATLEYNRLIDAILHVCLAQMRVLQAGVFVRREADDTELLLHRDYIGFELDHATRYAIHPEHPVRDLLLPNMQSYTPAELAAILGEESARLGFEGLPYQLLVPLVARGELQGIIVLGERIDGSEFSPDERRYMQDIGMLAAIAVYNAYLFDRATIDSLTRLKRRHVLEERMLEIFRDETSDEPLSLLMLDVDRFKSVNDTYGHSFGDVVLGSLAATVLHQTRTLDVAARYGGEEFAVLLPGSDIDSAFEVAERIRAAVEKTEFRPPPPENQAIQITVSLGVAQYVPGRDELPTDLLVRADEALYEAKNTGRNRVVVAS